jgi:hypothetical protein
MMIVLLEEKGAAKTLKIPEAHFSSGKILALRLEIALSDRIAF